MIRSTVSTSTRFAFVAYVLFALASNECRAQIDTTLRLDGHLFGVRDLVITIPSRSRDVVALPEAKAETVAVFPCVSIPMLLTYFPDADTEHIIDEGTSISAVGADGERIWVGFSFYSGEGARGVGGIGYYDLKTHRTGLLRHPALREYSVVEVLITEDTVYAKTVHNGELVETYGNGVVAISKKTLSAIARVPPGSQFLWDKDEYNKPNIRYQSSIAELISAKDLRPVRLPTWQHHDRAQIIRLGPDRFMEKTLEHDLLLCNPRSE